MTTTVEVLAAAFKDAGTPFIVGHPGGESVELMEAARQRQMRFLLMKQEVAGAMLAATWGDLTGSPGICLSTRGPGAANMVNGVAHAFLDRSPLIAITDSYSRPTYETGLRQRINQLAVYEPIVKWSTTIDAKTVRQQVRRAMRTATATPPGPGAFRISAERDLARGRRLRGRAAADAELDRARSGSRRSQAGAGHARQGETADPDCGLGRLLVRRVGRIRQFAERLGAPVLTTTKCKGMIPEDHPLRAGCIIGGLIERKLVHGIRPHRHRRPRRGGTAAQALALHAAGIVAVVSSERRRAGAGRSGNYRRPEGAAGRPRAMGAGGHELG